MEFQYDHALVVLERTPAVLASLLAGLSETWLAADEGPGTFSPRDVLGHLITGEEDDWVPRANYGRLLLLMTDLAAAAPHLKRAAELAPENPRVWLDLLSLYERSVFLEGAF